MGQGIDQLSSEDLIPEGYSEKLVNCDPTPEGYLTKRPGYQGVWGGLPVRVQRVDYSTSGAIQLTLDESIDLSGIPSFTHSRPVVAYGRTSASNSNSPAGDFPVGSDAGHWYSSFSADPRLAVAATSTTVLSMLESATGISTPYSWTGLAKSTSTSAQDNLQVTPSQVLTSLATSEVDATVVNGGAAFTVFPYFLPAPGSLGTSYLTAPVPVIASSTYDVFIAAGTHLLDTPNVQVKGWDLQAGVLHDVALTLVTINSQNTVHVRLTNGTLSTINLVLSLVASVDADQVTGSTGGGGSRTVAFATATPFTFASVYLANAAGTLRTQIQPTSVSYSSATGLTTVVFFVASSISTPVYHVYWQPVHSTTNRLTLQGAPVATGFSDLAPQLSVWGLDHSRIYATTQAGRGGWTTELDTYKAEAEQFLVAGLGGVLHQGQAATPAVAAAYQIPTLYPSLTSTVSADTYVGPAFQQASSGFQRTRGWVRADNVSAAGFLRATGIVWDSGIGALRVTLPLVNGSVSGTPFGNKDQVTVQGSGFKETDGTWNVVQATFTTGLVTVWFTVPGITSSLWDDPGSGASVGCFTDSITFSAADFFSLWVTGDLMQTDVLPQGLPVTCTRLTNSATSIWGGWTQGVFLEGGLLVSAKRTSNILPLRALSGLPSVTGVVTGDSLALTDYVRQMRVVSVNPLQRISLNSVVGDGFTATASFSFPDTSTMAVGDQFQLVDFDNVLTGVVTVSAIPSLQSFQFASSFIGTAVSVIVVGHTVQLDEVLAWRDAPDNSVTAAVPGRWLPLEAPDTTFNEVPGPYQTYLDSLYDAQPIVRSAQVTDSLILNNGVDRPLKLDGANVYRPGLTRWSPQLFMSIVTSGTGLIPIPIVSTTTVSQTGTSSIPTSGPAVLPWTGAQFNVTDGYQDTFKAGDRIQVQGSASPTIYTVQSVSQASTVSGTGSSAVTYQYGVITVDQLITEPVPTGTAVGTIVQLVDYTYYFRLNAVDTNRNVVASAVTGSVDWSFVATQNFFTRIRLVGLPAFLNTPMDYDRLEVQIYRTKSNGVAPFYLLTTLPMSFNANDGYLDWVDTLSDSDLADLDTVNTALKGQELGTGWSAPIRAERVTSLGNRLVLANLRSDPYIDLKFNNDGGIISQTVLSGLRFLLKRNFEDAGTTTDMVTRVGYQFLTSGALTISSITHDSTSFTLFFGSAHGRSVGQWLYLFRGTNPTGTTNQQTHLMGWWQIAAVTSLSITVSWADASTLGTINLTDEVDRVAVVPLGANQADVPVWIAADYNYAYGVESRYNTDVNAGMTPAENAATRRWSNAVNTTQRMVNRSLTGMTGFQPWICADGGGDFAVGQLIFRQPLADSTAFGLVLDSTYTTFTIYANDVLQAPGDTPSAVEQVRSSRLLISYPNFAEIFDNPLAAVDSQSDSAIDVNPSDGQHITAVIPMFGDSTFGAAMKDSVLMVFKTQSVYLVNLAAKAAGQNPLQKLETMGLGCTAPNSVAGTRNGIFFANENGLYRIDQQMTMYYLGRHIQRLWREDTNLDALDLVFGHNHAFASQYRISYPQSGASVPDAMFVYSSTREYSMQGISNTIQLYSTREGSWSQHLPAAGLGSIGFANLGPDSYYAGMNGRVFIRRATGLPQDYRDDNQAVAMDAWLRAMDFGDPGTRKTVPWAVVHYRNPADQGQRSGTQVLSSTDLSENWLAADLTVLADNASAVDSIGDTLGNRVVPYRYSFANKRGTQFQLRFTNSTVDEALEVTAVRYLVAGLPAPFGVREAASGPYPAANPATGRTT
jgi:hypothetical protein